MHRPATVWSVAAGLRRGRLGRALAERMIEALSMTDCGAHGRMGMGKETLQAGRG